MMFGLTGMFVVSADQEIIAVISGGFAGGSLYMVRYMMAGISNLQADGTMKHKAHWSQRPRILTNQAK